MRRLLAALALSACSTTLPQGRVPLNPSPGFTPDETGLAVIGTGMRIDFSRSPEGVIAILDRTYGRHKSLPLDNCPSGIIQQLRWKDLILTFTDERFVGWKQDAVRAGQTCRD